MNDPFSDLLGVQPLVFRPDRHDPALPDAVLISSLRILDKTYIRVFIPEWGFAFTIPAGFPNSFSIVAANSDEWLALRDGIAVACDIIANASQRLSMIYNSERETNSRSQSCDLN